MSEGPVRADVPISMTRYVLSGQTGPGQRLKVSLAYYRASPPSSYCSRNHSVTPIG